MKKNWLTIIGILFIVIGTVISYFAKWELADVSGFAVTMFGAGLASANLWNKRKEDAKTYLCIISLALVGVGAFIAGFTGLIAESTMTTIMASIFGFVMIIAGLIVSAVNKTK
jgi:uncharacterized protein YjeT (DUF2065 family)